MQLCWKRHRTGYGFERQAASERLQLRQLLGRNSKRIRVELNTLVMTGVSDVSDMLCERKRAESFERHGNHSRTAVDARTRDRSGQPFSTDERCIIDLGEGEKLQNRLQSVGVQTERL